MPENPVTPDAAAGPAKEPGAAAERDASEGAGQAATKPAADAAPPAGETPDPKPAPPPASAAQAKPAAAAPGAKPAPPRPAAPAKPAPAAKKEPSREEIDAARAKAVALFEETRRLGEELTVSVEHKSVTFTGRVVRVEPEDGFVVLEHVDGRRKGLYFILGGHAETKDGRRIEFPLDGVAR